MFIVIVSFCGCDLDTPAVDTIADPVSMVKVVGPSSNLRTQNEEKNDTLKCRK